MIGRTLKGCHASKRKRESRRRYCGTSIDDRTASGSGTLLPRTAVLYHAVSDPHPSHPQPHTTARVDYDLPIVPCRGDRRELHDRCTGSTAEHSATRDTDRNTSRIRRTDADAGDGCHGLRDELLFARAWRIGYRHQRHACGIARTSADLAVPRNDRRLTLRHYARVSSAGHSAVGTV